jgi:hypothetical protein
MNTRSRPAPWPSCDVTRRTTWPRSRAATLSETKTSPWTQSCRVAGVLSQPAEARHQHGDGDPGVLGQPVEADDQCLHGVGGVLPHALEGDVAALEGVAQRLVCHAQPRAHRCDRRHAGELCLHLPRCLHRHVGRTARDAGDEPQPFGGIRRRARRYGTELPDRAAEHGPPDGAVVRASEQSTRGIRAMPRPSEQASGGGQAGSYFRQNASALMRRKSCSPSASRSCGQSHQAMRSRAAMISGAKR